MQTAFIVITSILFTVFLFSTLQDPRRFRNGLFFFAFLTSFAITLLVKYHDTPAGAVIGIAIVLLILFLVLIVPLLLIINGFQMLKKEGHSFSNLLSMFFGMTIFFGEFALFASYFDSYQSTPLIRGLLFATGYGIFYASIIFLCFMFYTWIIKILPRRVDYDYVIVLGSGLINGDRVSRLLSDRIDRGIAIYNKSMSSCKIIVSGGQGKDETISEAEAMKRYLIDHEIPEHDILVEDESKNTMENLTNSKEIIQSRKGRQYTAVVTSNYHIFRAMIYAKRINLPCTGIGARTAFYYWPGAMIREYIALIKYYFWLFLFGYLLTASFLYIPLFSYM